jgi:hypothetical protein
MRTGYVDPHLKSVCMPVLRCDRLSNLTHSATQDTVNVAKQCAALAAQMILPEQAPRSSFIEHLLALPKPDTLWHTRAAMLPFLQYARTPTLTMSTAH